MYIYIYNATSRGMIIASSDSCDGRKRGTAQTGLG